MTHDYPQIKSQPRGPYRLEGEVHLDRIGFDRHKLCSEVHAGGFVIGYWVDAEWNGNGPLAEAIADIPDFIYTLADALESGRLAGIHQHPESGEFLPWYRDGLQLLAKHIGDEHAAHLDGFLRRHDTLPAITS